MLKYSSQIPPAHAHTCTHTHLTSMFPLTLTITEMRVLLSYLCVLKINRHLLLSGNMWQKSAFTSVTFWFGRLFPFTRCHHENKSSPHNTAPRKFSYERWDCSPVAHSLSLKETLKVTGPDTGRKVLVLISENTVVKTLTFLRLTYSGKGGPHFLGFTLIAGTSWANRMPPREEAVLTQWQAASTSDIL